MSLDANPALLIPTKYNSILSLPQVEIKEFEKRIFSVHYKGACEVDLSLLKTIKEAIEISTPCAAYSLLITADSEVVFTREVRLFRPGPVACQMAWALVATNLAHLLIYRYFIRSHKTNPRFRVFRKSCEALAWLASLESRSAKV